MFEQKCEQLFTKIQNCEQLLALQFFLTIGNPNYWTAFAHICRRAWQPESSEFARLFSLFRTENSCSTILEMSTLQVRRVKYPYTPPPHLVLKLLKLVIDGFTYSTYCLTIFLFPIS